jgi:hypothetical protein
MVSQPTELFVLGKRSSVGIKESVQLHLWLEVGYMILALRIWWARAWLDHLHWAEHRHYLAAHRHQLAGDALWLRIGGAFGDLLLLQNRKKN